MCITEILQVPRGLPPATVGQNATGQISQAKSVVEFAIREQSRVGGDAAALGPRFAGNRIVPSECPKRALIAWT